MEGPSSFHETAETRPHFSSCHCSLCLLTLWLPDTRSHSQGPAGMGCLELYSPRLGERSLPRAGLASAPLAQAQQGGRPDPGYLGRRWYSFVQLASSSYLMLADDRKTDQSRSWPVTWDLLPSERERVSQAITHTRGRKELHRKSIDCKGPSSGFSFQQLCPKIKSSKTPVALETILNSRRGCYS